MISRILNHFKPRSITKEALAPQIDAYLTSQFIAKAITSGAPFLASRLGFTEARCLSQPEGIENPSDFVMDLIWRYSGVFPASREQFREFGSIYLEALSQVDLLGLICNPAEKKLVDVHARNVVTCDLGSMAAYAGKMASPESLVISRLKSVGFPAARTMIHKGFFDKLLPKRLNFPERVAFAYVDFDFHDPIKQALEFLDEVASPGAIFVVDDYDYFSSGAKEAVDAFVKIKNANKRRYKIEIPAKALAHCAVLTKF